MRVRGDLMAAQTKRSGASIVREAFGNTGKGERTLYALLIGVGIALIIVGWHAEGHGWATAHPYFVGLLIGATGFCFGVPVAGIVIREATRRASQSAELRNTARAITSQLDYLDRIVEALSPGPIVSAGDRLRKLANSARLAMPRTSAHAQTAEGKVGVRFWVISAGVSGGALGVQPVMKSEVAAELRGVVEGGKLWASVGFSCGRLGGDIIRLVPILYPPAPSQQAIPDWLDELTSALQSLLVLQLPVHRRWLPAAVQNPPAVVPITFWSSKPEAGFKVPFLPPGSLGGSPDRRSEPVTADVQNAVQEQATDELRGELFALAHHLEALAALIGATERCRIELTPLA